MLVGAVDGGGGEDGALGGGLVGGEMGGGDVPCSRRCCTCLRGYHGIYG